MIKTIQTSLRNRRQGEEGFTLVELLVVVVIIGILVAIAIPVFLNQREKGWESEAKSDLRNAAPVAETYYSDEGTYDGFSELLADYPLLHGADVNISVEDAGPTSYCIQVTHDKLSDATDVWSLNSTTGVVAKVAC